MFYEALLRLHGHRCPMSILGARLGLAARAALDAGSQELRLTARYHHRTCALDGIQLATHCTLGNGNIQVEPRGEHRLVLWVQETGYGVEVRLTGGALEKGRTYGRLREAAAALPVDSPDRQRIQEDMDAILRHIERAPDSQLLCVEPRTR